jgi:drug/metabolite transporter (DMT)-like permease
MNFHKNWLLLIYSLGIIVSFVIREYYIDKLYDDKYGPEQEPFKLSILIVFIQSIINCFYAVSVYLFCRRFCSPKIEIISEKEAKKIDKIEKKESKDKSKLPKPRNESIYKIIFDFSIPAIAQVIAGFLGNKSMEYVDNTTKTLAKSVKPIPILILGVIFQNKRYHFMKYIGIIFVTLGVTSFMSKSSSQAEIPSDLYFGLFLSVLALFMDGIVGTTQDWLEEKHQPSAFTLMFSTNIWALLVSAVTMYVFNEYSQSATFLYKYPSVTWELFLVTISFCIGNQFIFLIIQQFGSLQCSIVTTTRKLITILFNSIALSRNLSYIQWISVAIVFIGLGLDIVYKDKKVPEKPQQDKNKKE